MCPNESQLHAYHDGEMPAEQHAAFEAHLRDCGDCRAALDELKGLSRMFVEVPLAEMSPRASGKMYGAFHAARAARERGVRHLAGWLTVAAAAILVMVCVRPGTRSGDNDSLAVIPSSSWGVETVAVMPPLEPRNGANSEIVQFAQWMASDLGDDQTQTQ